RFRGGAGTPTGSFDEIHRRLGLQGLAVDDPRPVGQRVLARDLATFDGQSHRARTHAECGGSLIEFEPALLTAALPREAWDLVPPPERHHALARPAVATPRAQLVPVEHPGNHVIGADPGQTADGGHHVLRCMVHLPATSPGESKLRVHTPFPVDMKN